MNAVAGINNQVNPINQPNKSESKTVNNTGVSFTSVFEVVKKSLDGIMVVAGNNKASEANMTKDKLEIEQKRKFKTDLEEAHEILDKIAKLMEKQGRNQG